MAITDNVIDAFQYVTDTLSVGIGGIEYHGSLIQADKYLVVGSFRANRHHLQAIKGEFVTADIPVSSVTLPKLLNAVCALQQSGAKNWSK